MLLRASRSGSVGDRESPRGDVAAKALFGLTRIRLRSKRACTTDGSCHHLPLKPAAARHRIPRNSRGSVRLFDSERDGARFGVPVGRRPDPGRADIGLRPRQLLGWPVGSDRMRHEQPRVRK